MPTDTARHILEELWAIRVIERVKEEENLHKWRIAENEIIKKLEDIQNYIKAWYENRHSIYENINKDTPPCLLTYIHPKPIPRTAPSILPPFSDEDIKWGLNHLKNHKQGKQQVPLEFFVGEFMKAQGDSFDRSKIEELYEFLCDSEKLTRFVEERKKIREEDTYRDLKFAPDYNKKLLSFLVSQGLLTIEKDAEPYTGRWYVWAVS